VVSTTRNGDKGVEALYGLPLGEFVAARNALAKERNDPEIKKLKKPSATAWALNQLARRAPDEMEALLDAAVKVADTQAGAVRGRGSAPFREAVQAERDAMNPLLQRARRLLKAEPAVARVADALRAAAADRRVHDDLRAGCITEEPTSGGFGGLEGLDVGPTGGEGEETEDAAAQAQAEAGARVERERRELEHVLEMAEREAARSETRAADAEERAAHLRGEANEARARADEAARRLAALD
jgi:hypothetical protein